MSRRTRVVVRSRGRRRTSVEIEWGSSPAPRERTPAEKKVVDRLMIWFTLLTVVLAVVSGCST